MTDAATTSADAVTVGMTRAGDAEACHGKGGTDD